MRIFVLSAKINGQMIVTGNRFLFFALCCIVLAAAACRKATTDADNPGIFNFSSDNEKAVELVSDANNDLKQIKILYNENEGKLDEFKDALAKNDIAKVKQIANNLVYVINDGFVFADSAKSKLAAAQELDINPKFKDYLSLKEESLDKEIEAFGYRHEAARLLRESFGTQDKLQIEQVRQIFKEKEQKFQTTMETAREISRQADELAKESVNSKS